MGFQTNPQRGGGHEGIAYFGFEAGMLADDASVIGAMPTMALMGFSSSPGLSVEENPTERESVGTGRPVGPDKPGRRDSSMPGSMLLAGTPMVKDILRAALRYDDTVPTSQRFECMPLFALATGLAGRCNVALDDQEVGRYCVMEQVQIDWAEGQDTRLTYTAQALSLVGSTAFSSPSEAAILAASGDAFNLQESYWSMKYDGVSIGGLDNVFNTASLVITNEITRSGTRHPDDTLGLANPVSLIPYFWEIGKHRVVLNLNTKSRLNYFDECTIINENPNGYLGFQLDGITRASRGRDETAASARFGFPSSHKVSRLSLIEDEEE